MVENRATGCPDLKVHSRIVCDTSNTSLHTSAAEPAVKGVIYIIITSHGEDGSRPQRPHIREITLKISIIQHQNNYIIILRFSMPWSAFLVISGVAKLQCSKGGSSSCLWEKSWRGTQRVDTGS